MSFKSQDDNPLSFNVHTYLDSRDFKVVQDVTSYLDYAAQQRELDAHHRTPGTHYRSSFIMPDIVAIDILTKYGIDVHAPDFMYDAAAKRRVKAIVYSEYPKLLTSNIRRNK
jgi:hypothetical protein